MSGPLPPLPPSVWPGALPVGTLPPLGAPIQGPPGAILPSQTPQHTKKRTSFTACAACQSKHCACDEHRPCNRCLRLNIACTEGVPRKGKSKKKPGKEPKLSDSGDSFAMLERELLASKRPSQFSQQYSQPAPSASLGGSSDFFDPSYEHPFDVNALNGSPAGSPAAGDGFTAMLNDNNPFDATSFGNSGSLTAEMLEGAGVVYLGKDVRVPTSLPTFLASMANMCAVGQATKRAQNPSHASSVAAPDASALLPHTGGSPLGPSPHGSPMHDPTMPRSPSNLSPSAAAPSSRHSSPSGSPIIHSSPTFTSALTPPGASSPNTANEKSTQEKKRKVEESLPRTKSDDVIPTSSVVMLHEEISKLKQELAYVRNQRGRSFPMAAPVKPHDFGMCLWSLPDGVLLDFSAGFLSLLSFKTADNITFDLISPPETRMQRRHLRAFFVCERPDINNMVACKVLLDAYGKRLEVMCRTTLIHFDTMSLLQTFFWRQ